MKRICRQLLNHTLAVFALAFAGCCDGGDTGEPTARTLEAFLNDMGYQAVEFEHDGPVQPFVEGVLGNGHKHRFLVDTGWGITSLSESAARDLKRIGQSGEVLEDPILGTVTNTAFVVLDRLKIGDVQFLNQPARLQQLRAEFITVPFDGALGYDFLLRNFCLIDCWKRRMYVRGSKPSSEESKVLAETLRLCGFSEVPLEPGYLLSVRAVIDHQAVLLGVDTGAAFEELDDSELKPLGLTILKSSRPPTGSLIESDVTGNVIGLGEIGRHRLHVTKVDSFLMGPKAWKNIYFAVLNLKEWGLAKPGTRGERVKGLVSQGLLSRHGALIDIPGHKLWLRQEKP